MEDHLGMFFLSFSSDVRGLYVAALVLGGAPLNPPVSPQLKERSALLHLGPRNACHSRMPLGFANRSRVKCFHQTRLSTYLPAPTYLPTYLPPSVSLCLSLSLSLSLFRFLISNWAQRRFQTDLPAQSSSVTVS